MQQYSQGAQHGAASSRTVTTGFGDDPNSRLRPRPISDQKQHDGSTPSLLEQLLQAASYSPAVTDLLLEQQLQHHQHAAQATPGQPPATSAAGASMGPPCYVPASYLASLQQQQQHQQLQQQALPLAGAALQPAADEVQCISEQMEDALLSSSLSYGAASPSAGSQQLLQPSLQQARSSQLLTQSQLRSSSSGPGQKSDSGQRKGASSKPGGKRVAAHAKLQLLYNAKLAEYDQLKAEQESLLMDQGLVLGMVRVMEQVLRAALTQAFSSRTAGAAAAACSSAAGEPAPLSVRAAAAAASEMLRKALAMEQQVEQMMAEQQRLLQCVPAAAAAESTVPCGGALVGSLLSQGATADMLHVSALDWPQLCKDFGGSVSLLLHMLSSPTAGARAAAQLHNQCTQHLQCQLALMLQEPHGCLRVLAEAAQQLEARHTASPNHLLDKVAPAPQQAAQLRRLAALHGELQEQLRRRAVLLQHPLAAAASKDAAVAAAAAAAGGAGGQGGSDAAVAALLGLSLAGVPLAQHLAHTEQREAAAAALGRVLQMQVTLWGAAAHQCLALLSEQQAAMAFVACHPHTLDPLLLAGLAAEAAIPEPAAAEPATEDASYQT